MTREVVQQAMTVLQTQGTPVSARDVLRILVELLKCTGMYGGVVNVVSERDPEKIIKKQAEAQVQREGIPEDATERMLIDMSRNPVYRRRVEEIEAELYREYGEA
jgi:hypothetical protein